VPAKGKGIHVFCPFEFMSVSCRIHVCILSLMSVSVTHVCILSCMSVFYA